MEVNSRPKKGGFKTMGDIFDAESSFAESSMQQRLLVIDMFGAGIEMANLIVR